MSYGKYEIKQVTRYVLIDHDKGRDVAEFRRHEEAKQMLGILHAQQGGTFDHNGDPITDFSGKRTGLSIWECAGGSYDIHGNPEMNPQHFADLKAFKAKALED